MLKLALGAMLGLLLAASVCAAPATEAFAKLPGVEFMRLSPSGGRYAFVAVIGERRGLGVVGSDGKALITVPLSESKVRDIEWVGEDHVLATVSSTFKDQIDLIQDYELDSTINIRLDVKKSAVIFGDRRDIANTTVGYFGSAHVDGHTYAYFGGITYRQTPTVTGLEYVFDHGYPDLYRVDLDTNETSIAARGNELYHHWLMAPDGRMLAHVEYDERDGIWRLFNGHDDDKKLLEKKAPLHEIGLNGQGRTEGAVLVEDSTGDEDVEEEISLADGSSQILFDSQNLLGYLFDPVTGLLIGARTHEEPHAVFFDRKLQARFNGTRKAFPGLQVKLVSYSHNLDKLIVMTDGGDDSGTYWLVDIASGNADPVGYAYPKIHPADVAATQWFQYKASDGLPIEAVLTLPPGHKAEKLPLVVLPHGGPIDIEDRPGFDWWAQAYASAGYAVLQPNYRGSSGYGRDFSQAGYGQWGRKMQTDLSDGVAALAAQGAIDPKRVAIVGASYGGYAALAGVTLQQGLYRCAVSGAGPSDLPALFHWESDRHRYQSAAVRFWRALTGADTGGYEAMREISPALFANKADAPILLIHGTDDTVVPIEQSERMASALKSASKPYEYLVLNNEDHWLSREETRTQMLKAAVDFVKKNNPPD